MKTLLGLLMILAALPAIGSTRERSARLAGSAVEADADTNATDIAAVRANGTGNFTVADNGTLTNITRWQRDNETMTTEPVTEPTGTTTRATTTTTTTRRRRPRRRRTTTTTTTTTTPAPPDWSLLPRHRCLCQLDRQLRWARQKLIRDILRLERARATTTKITTAARDTTTSATTVGVTGSEANSPTTGLEGNTTTTGLEGNTTTTGLEGNTTTTGLEGNTTTTGLEGNMTTEAETGNNETTAAPEDEPTVTPTQPTNRRRRSVGAVDVESSEYLGNNTNQPCQNVTLCANETLCDANGTAIASGNDTLSRANVPGRCFDTSNNVTEITPSTTTTATTTTTTTRATTTRTTRPTTTTRPERVFPPGVIARGSSRNPQLALCSCHKKAEGVFGTIRIMNLIWRTVLMYKDTVEHKRATKYIHEQLDLIFRRALGSWYATSEVISMEEGSVVAHHKVYLTRKVDNITHLVTRSFEIGYKSGVSSMDVANDSVSYYFPEPPPEKPAIWYLRYLALVIALGILVALAYDVLWRTNACAVRAPWGYLEPEADEKAGLRKPLKQSIKDNWALFTASAITAKGAVMGKIAAMKQAKEARKARQRADALTEEAGADLKAELDGDKEQEEVLDEGEEQEGERTEKEREDEEPGPAEAGAATAEAEGEPVPDAASYEPPDDAEDSAANEPPGTAAGSEDSG